MTIGVIIGWATAHMVIEWVVTVLIGLMGATYAIRQILLDILSTNKTKTLNKKYLGVTEYISHSFNQKKFAMLIYNKKLSVCPVTTHLPVSQITKKINRKLIKEKIIIVNNFYKKFLGFKPRIAVTGLNPHCESISKFNEDKELIKPTIEILKKLNPDMNMMFPQNF